VEVLAFGCDSTKNPACTRCKGGKNSNKDGGGSNFLGADSDLTETEERLELGLWLLGRRIKASLAY